MKVQSKMEAWRAAEVELAAASKEFCRIVLEDRDRFGLDETHVVLQKARDHALQSMHSALEQGLLELSGVYWTAWQRRVVDFERRIMDSSSRVADLERSLSDATAQRAADAIDDEPLRNQQHLLGLYKHELNMLLERPKDGARLGFRAELAAEQQSRDISWTRAPSRSTQVDGAPIN